MMSGSASEQLAPAKLGTEVDNLNVISEYRRTLDKIDRYLDTCGEDAVMYSIQAMIDELTGRLRAIGG